MKRVSSMKYSNRFCSFAGMISIIVVVCGIGFYSWCSQVEKSTNNDSPSNPTSNLDSRFSPDTVFTATQKVTLNTYPKGTIIFGSLVSDPSPHYEYYLINADGTPLANIGEFTGFSSWSPDGKSLAIGCVNLDQICILDMTSIFVYRSFPVYTPENYGKLVVRKLVLPQECRDINMPDWGINSLSWSKDGKQLVVVCSSKPSETAKSEVCFLTLSGTSYCWSTEKSEGIRKAVFSPTEDTIAISKNGEIVLVDEGGNFIRELTSGTNPSWSPDGEKIAYFDYYKKGPRNGIGIINKDGTNSDWLYLQPESSKFDEFLCAICEGWNRGGISWSPDGKFITFSADYLGNYAISIFRQNLETKEITILVGLNGFFEYPVDPNWGSIEYR